MKYLIVFKAFSTKNQQWEKSVACVSVPLMGEKLPYYCRVKKILAALKNGPKLGRPVIKSALEKLSLCLRVQFSNNANGLPAPPCPDLALALAAHLNLKCTSVGPSVNKATSVSVKADNSLPWIVIVGIVIFILHKYFWNSSFGSICHCHFYCKSFLKHCLWKEVSC